MARPSLLERVRELLGGPPIDRAALTTEQAGPTSSFVRNPYGMHAAPGLTPVELAQILRSSIDGFPERYLALAEDMEERFSHYGSVLATRKRAVARLPVTVAAAGDEKADEDEAALVREVVESAAFRLSLIDMLDAIGKGFSATEIIWETGSVWKPRAFEWRDPRFFEFDRLDPHKLLLIGAGGREELKTAGWIVHLAKAKSGLPIRGGLARQVAWPFLFETFNGKDWAVFAEAYGHPLRIGKYDQGASPEDKAKLLAAVEQIASDFAAIIPKETAIEIVAAELAGSTDLFERRAKFLEQRVSKIVLGQTGTTDVISGGGYASSKVHDEVRDDIRDSDAEQLAATLNERLVIPLVLLNFPFRDRKGFPQIAIAQPDEEDVGAWTDNVVKLVPLGLEVSMDEAQRKLGVTPPPAGAKLLTAPASAPAAVSDEERLPAPARERAAAARLERRSEPDAVDLAVAELLADGGWEELVGPAAAGLARALEDARNLDEVRELLAARLDVAALTERLAHAMFAARLAGAAGEDLD